MAEPDDTLISEGLPGGLIRVLKTIKRRLRDGRTVDVEQAFHVKKAAAGDRYAHRHQADLGSPISTEAEEQQDDGQEPQQDPPQAADSSALPEVSPPLPPKRMAVKAHDIPWIVDGLRERPKAVDPIPRELRSRFAKGNKAGRIPLPFAGDAPMTGVDAGDSIMWGSYEPDIIMRLRAGAIVGLRSAGAQNGCLVARVESQDGVARSAYMRVDGLNDPFVYKAWGKLYELDRKNGSASRLSAAAYEVAKASGFDDLVPPTVYRTDEYGDLGPILSAELIERSNAYCESLAAATGETPEVLRRRVRGYSSLQLYSEGVHTIDKEKWFSGIFSKGSDSDRKDVLNHVFDALPPKIRAAFLRVAALDFLLWTGERSLASLLFCSHDRHPVHLIGNELSLPNPRRLAAAYKKHGGAFLDEPPAAVKQMPMLWSDISLALAARGGEAELRMFEQIGIETAMRMKGDRSVDLARTLLEFQIDPLAVAATLARAGALGTHSGKIARNPLMMAAYYAELVDGVEIPADHAGVSVSVELAHVIPPVNFAMSKVLARDYDFVAEMKRGSDDGDL